MKEIEIRVYGQQLPTGDYIYSLCDKDGKIRVQSRNVEALMGVYQTLSDYYKLRGDTCFLQFDFATSEQVNKRKGGRKE